MNIVISKRSWHYRMVAYIFERGPGVSENLCGYFWQLVLWAPLIWLLVAAVSPLVLIWWLLQKLPIDWHSDVGSSLIADYLHARKQKICPFIEFED